MYPIFRLALSILNAKRAGPLEPLGTNVSTHICWPWDLDFYFELNNGRTLTLNDLNRIPLALRTGLISVMRREKWGLTVAGASVRYRRRVRMFDRITITSRLVCWDDKFFYLEQSMWVRGNATSNVLYRIALVDSSGIVKTELISKSLGFEGPSPETPSWIEAWIEAERRRPWPPEGDYLPDNKKK